MTKELEADLNVSHAFLNALSSNYQGWFVFLKVMNQFAPSPQGDEAIQKTAQSLDKINAWWRDFLTQKPLLHLAERPKVEGAAAEAWEFLQIAKNRNIRLANNLKKTGKLEALMASAGAVMERVAADCCAAYSRQHYIHGLIKYGEAMGREDVVDRWNQQTPSTQQGVQSAHYYLDVAQKMGGELNQKTVAEILDETLVLAGVFTQRTVETDEIFGLYTGQYTFESTGIPPEQIPSWRDLGFTPTLAGQWYWAGLDAPEAVAWHNAGFDTIAWLHFGLRGFNYEAALPWWTAGMGGRTAAAWTKHGCNVEQAKEWRAKGVGHPSMIGRT